MKYTHEVEIVREVLMFNESLALRLKVFFHHHEGWEMFDRYYNDSKVILFSDTETFKQFLIEFAETRHGHALNKTEALEELKKVLIA